MMKRVTSYRLDGNKIKKLNQDRVKGNDQYHIGSKTLHWIKVF